MPVDELEKTEALVPDITAAEEIRSLIHIIRGKQVILDSDLAMLYQVETRRLNEAVKRNLERFPEEFRFQLTENEYVLLMSQFATSSLVVGNGHGGRRKLPYAFTEQGIAMLSAVLHSEIAVQVSIRIINAFVEMRRFMTANATMLERIGDLELKQLELQKSTDERFEKVFEYIGEHEESTQHIFFAGQIYDAASLIISLIQKAHKEIILIDNYTDNKTLDLLSKKNNGVKITLYTSPKTAISQNDIKAFNAQYPQLDVQPTTAFHDRYLIIDGETAYHIGASIKDAGKKCFGISELFDKSIIENLLKMLS